MIAFVFPGQGSQKRGMGQGLFELREYADAEPQVDAMLGYSLRRLCLEDPDNLLKQTQYTQPALYVVNALHYYKAIHEGLRPAYVAGHSLGEYNALLAAGAFDLLTGLRLVRRRGELMSQVRNGGMAAVIGLDAKRIAQLLEQNALFSIDVANFNSRSQTVISGPVEDIRSCADIFEKAGASMYVPLPVSAAFHSRYVADAASSFAEFLAPMSFGRLSVPVIANATGEPYPAEDPSQSIKSLLVRQITHSVYWVQSVRWLLAHGAREFRELGPGNVLTRLIQQIQQE